MNARRELIIGLGVAGICVLMAGPLGLIWSALAPHIALRPATSFSEPVVKRQLGDDVWFGYVALVAGVVLGLLFSFVGRFVHGLSDGPGAAAGLVVGCTLASIGADRVGYLVRHGPFIAAVFRLGPGPQNARFRGLIINSFDFRVHALPFLVVLPVAALVTYGLIQAVRHLSEPFEAGLPRG